MAVDIQPLYWRFKVILLFTMFLSDVAIHCSLEYDNFGYGKEYVQALLSGVQIFIQVGVFVVIFSIMAETYPFQNGMLGFVKNEFGIVATIVPLYTAFTSCLVGYRVSKINSGELIVDVWASKTYTAFSLMNKIVCPVCHGLGILTVVTLTDPDFYSEEGWNKKILGNACM